MERIYKLIYVIMSDGKVVVPDFLRRNIYGGIDFDIDTVSYRYSPIDLEEELSCVGPVHLKLLHTPQRRFEELDHGEWIYTNQIAYLYEIINEEENELNFFDCTQFNAGVIYDKIERVVVPMLKDTTAASCKSIVTIPAIQLLPKIIHPPLTEYDIIKRTEDDVIRHFDAVYGKQFKLEFIKIEHNVQYIELHYVITRKEQYKEMTVEQIEKALGYKIKIVGDK